MNHTGYPQRTAQGSAGDNFENESDERERTIQLPQQHAEYMTPHNEQFALRNTAEYGRPGINPYNSLQHGDMHQGNYYNQPGNYGVQPRAFEQQGLLPSSHFTTPAHRSQLQGEQYQQPWGGDINAVGFPCAQDVSSFASLSQNPPVSHRRHYQTHSEEFVHNPPIVTSNAPSHPHPRDIASASANTTAGTQNVHPAAIGTENSNAMAMQPGFPTAPLGGNAIPGPVGTNTPASRRLKPTPQASTSTSRPSKRKVPCHHCSYRQIKCTPTSADPTLCEACRRKGLTSCSQWNPDVVSKKGRSPSAGGSAAAAT